MKKFITILLFVLALFISAATGNAQQSKAEKLYQQALYEMEALGNYNKAIELFNQVLTKSPKEKALGAKALLHVGMCYEKLGRSEAQKAYERIVKEFADQSSVVKEARARLIALGNEKKPEEKPAMTTHQVWADYPTDRNTGLLFGAPSPDGRYIAFADHNTGDLAIRELATGEIQSVANSGNWTEGFALQPIVSPDSKQIAYQWPDPKKDWSWGIRIVGLDKSSPRILYHNTEVGWPVPLDWSPDGKYILALLGGRGDGSNQIALLAVADGSVRVLKTLDWRSPQKMCFSPDGRYIVYDFPPEENSPNRDLFLLSTDASREIPLVKHPADDFLLGWAPDGKTVIFASDRTGTIGAWMIRVADGRPQGSPELVKPDIGRIQPLGFARNGSYYYGLSTGLRDLYIAELDSATGKLVSPPVQAAQRFLGTNRTPEWSPDGKYLAYLSRRGNQTNQFYKDMICIRSVESGEMRELFPKVGYMARLRWYPDGRSVLVMSYGGKSFLSLFRVDANTGEATIALRAEAGGFPHFQLAPDGRTIFFGRYEADLILARDLITGKEKEIYRGSTAGNWTLSPDGRHLAVIAQGQGTQPNVLKVMPVTGAEPRELFRDLERFTPVAWMSDGRHLIFGRVAQPEGKTELWRISIEGGEPQKLGMVMENMEDLHVSPDGRRIVFVAGQPKGEVWVMENFLSRSLDSAR